MDLCCRSLVDYDRFYRDADFVDGKIVGVLQKQNKFNISSVLCFIKTNLWDSYFLVNEYIVIDQQLELLFETVSEHMEKLWHSSSLHQVDVVNSKNYLVAVSIFVASKVIPGNIFDYGFELWKVSASHINTKDKTK